jgi:hypothetical protein
MFTFLAQKPTPLGTLGGEGLGPFGVGLTQENIGLKFAGALSAIIGFLTVVAGLWFIFQFIIGAIQWLASGGEKTGLEQARNKITNSFIGLILVVAAVAVISLLGTFLGFEILNPAKFIELIRFR